MEERENDLLHCAFNSLHNLLTSQKTPKDEILAEVQAERSRTKEEKKKKKKEEEIQRQLCFLFLFLFLCSLCVPQSRPSPLPPSLQNRGLPHIFRSVGRSRVRL